MAAMKKLFAEFLGTSTPSVFCLPDAETRG
jgi:hypothetical protein